jgi:hypothetical protein
MNDCMNIDPQTGDVSIGTVVHPDPRERSKLFPPGGPFAPHRCAICNGRFEVGQQFYNYGQGEVVHTACKFKKEKNT